MKTEIRNYQSMPGLLRFQTLDRDNYTCQDCGFKGGPGIKHGTIQVHHIKAYRLGGEHKLDNLITVCTACHKKRDRAHWVSRIREWQIRYGHTKLTTE